MMHSMTPTPLPTPLPTPAAPTAGTANLFVAGLPPTVDDAALEQLFTPFGEVLSAKVMVDLHTAVSRGFGFVLLRDLEAARRAQAALHGAPPPPGAAHPPGVSAADGAQRGAAALVVEFSAKHSATHVLTKSNAIYVRNIPAATTAEAVQAHFNSKMFAGSHVEQQQQQPVVRHVAMLPDTAPNATAAYIVARVTFASHEVAARAERLTQCSPNVFATGLDANAPPLLAKLAEDPSDRARRLNATRRNIYAGDNICSSSTAKSPAGVARPAAGLAPYVAAAPLPPPVMLPQRHNQHQQRLQPAYGAYTQQQPNHHHQQQQQSGVMRAPAPLSPMPWWNAMGAHAPQTAVGGPVMMFAAPSGLPGGSLVLVPASTVAGGVPAFQNQQQQQQQQPQQQSASAPVYFFARDVSAGDGFIPPVKEDATITMAPVQLSLVPGAAYTLISLPSPPMPSTPSVTQHQPTQVAVDIDVGCDLLRAAGGWELPSSCSASHNSTPRASATGSFTGVAAF